MKPSIMQLQFTRKMRSFAFPYPPLQKKEERSWDNRTVCSGFHQLPTGRRISSGSHSLLPGSGGVGSRGWCAHCIPMKDSSELLLLSPPRPFASMVCCLCGNRQQILELEVLAEAAAQIKLALLRAGLMPQMFLLPGLGGGMGRDLLCCRSGAGGRFCALLRQQREQGLTSVSAIAARELLLFFREGSGLPPAGGGISPVLTIGV